MKLTIRDLALAGLSAALVHRGVLSFRLNGADRGRLSGYAPEAGEGALGLSSEYDLGPFVYRGLATGFGDNEPLYAGLALGVLIVAAVTLARAARRLAATLEISTDTRIDVGALVALLFPAWALHVDALGSLPGLMSLLGATLFGTLLDRALRRNEAFNSLALPLVASVAFAETWGLSFLLIPLLVGAAKKPFLASFRAQPKRSAALGALIIARCCAPLIYGLPLGARDASPADAPEFGPRLADALSFVIVPASRDEGFANGGHTAFLAGFGLVALALIIPAVLSGGRKHRRALALVGAWTLVAGTVVAMGPAMFTDGGEARILLPVSVAFLFALAFSAAPRLKSGPRGVIVGASLAFFLYSSHNAAEELRQARNEALFPVEWDRVHEALEARVAEGHHNILIAGLFDPEGRIHWERALPASRKRPFGSDDARVRALSVENLDRVSAHFLPDDGDVTVSEWWPRSVLHFGRNRQGWPKYWDIVPIFRAPALRLSETPIRLIEPAPEARLSLEVPKTIEDDMRFVFETEPGFALRDGECFAFYGHYAGGLSPKGRGEIRARPLIPDVLAQVTLADGTTRYTWRPSVRPEAGHDGLRFEGRDLDLAGRALFWTIGVVQTADAAAIATIRPGHSEHRHDRAMAGITAPTALAQTQRVHFQAQSSDG